MRLRTFNVLIALAVSAVTGGRSQADFLVAQDFATSKSIVSYGYTVGSSPSISNTATLVSGFTNTQGVAIGGQNLYVSGNTTSSSGKIFSYSLGSNGSGNIAVTANTGFGTNGVVSLTTPDRGISVTPDGSKVSVALINNLKAINVSTGNGGNVGPTLNLPTGATNVYKSVQNGAGDYFVLYQTGTGTSPYAIARFNSSGISQGNVTLTGFNPGTSSLRDIVFDGNNKFYLTNYASAAGGGGLYRFNLSGSTATLDTSFNSTGYKAIGNAFGVAIDSVGMLFVSQYYSSGSSAIVSINPLTAAQSTFLATTTSYGFQYLATTTVPEPTTYILAAASVGMLGFARKWRKKMPAAEQA